MLDVTKKEIKRTAELVKIIEEFNLFDETEAGQQLKEEFFKPEGRGKVFKELFRYGEIQKYPELYRYFFRNTKVPKIFSNKEWEFYPEAKDCGFGFSNTRKFKDMDIDWCKKETEEKYSNILGGILTYLPVEIRETIFCFYQMCNTLMENDMYFELYLEQVPHLKPSDYYGWGLEGKVFFIVWCHLKKGSYSPVKTEVSYSLVGNLDYSSHLHLGYELKLRYGTLYRDVNIKDFDTNQYSKVFENLRSTELKIDFEYLPFKTKPSRLENIDKSFEKCKKDFPEATDVLREKFRVKETSLEVLREEAECFNLVILPIEYSKFRRSTQYNEVVNRLGNCNVFVITTLDNYDPWEEIIDTQEEFKTKIFPTSLIQVGLAIQFSISSQRILYKMLGTLEKRVDELERAFNKNMEIIEAQIKQLQWNDGMLVFQVNAIAMKLACMEMREITSNKEKFYALEKKRQEMEDGYNAMDFRAEPIVKEQRKLIDVNHILEGNLRDIEKIMDSKGFAMEDFKLEVIKQKSKLEQFKAKVDKNGYVFVYTTAEDFYKNSIAYITF